MATLFYANQFITTTLAVVGGIDASQTTGIVFQSVTGIDTTKPTVFALNYSDPVNESIIEWCTCTSINSTTKEAQGVVRGAEKGSAKTHSNGVTVAFPLSEVHINNLATALSIGGAATNGVTGTIDDDTFATASATTIPTSESVKAYVDSKTPTDGWTPSGDTWVYASATTFTISGVDRTTQLIKGTKIKFTQTGTKYFYVVGSTFSTNTTVTIAPSDDYSIANATISSPHFSYQNNPQGFPVWMNYDGAVTAESGTITTKSSNCSYKVDGSFITYQGKISITTNGTGAAALRIVTPVTASADLTYPVNGQRIDNGNAVAGAVRNTGFAQIKTYNNSYPGADGASISFITTYEI